MQQQDAGAQIDIEGVRPARWAALDQLGVAVTNSLENYLHERAGDLTIRSLTETEKRCTAFVRWVGSSVEMATVTRVTAGQFLAKVIQPRPVSRTTKTKEISTCRGWFQWAMLRGEMHANPFDRMQVILKKSKRGTEAERRTWTDAELLVVPRGLKDDRLEPLLPPLTLLTLYTGMRLNEVCNLTLTDYDSAALVLHVREGKSQAAVGAIPIHPAISSTVATLSRETPDGYLLYLLPGLVPGGLIEARPRHRQDMGRRIRSLGIIDRRLVFHALRHFHYGRPQWWGNQGSCPAGGRSRAGGRDHD